jgi:hypothetical protein
MAEPEPLDDELYLMAKLVPRLTGLPMAVWVTQRDGYQHDVRVKVSRAHGARGSWPDAVPVAVRPTPRLVVAGSLSIADLNLVITWIRLNEAAIIDYWEEMIEIDEFLARLQLLPP